jgi:6-phosphogluconolactonase
MGAVFGEVRVEPDVPGAFADLVLETLPRSIALSGGETARAAYQRLAARAPDLSRTDVWFGDERWVPVDDPDSTEGMARATLLDRVATRRVHSMRGAAGTLARAAVAYDAELRAFPPLEVVHLGLGPDGHTASLFPGTDALRETERWVVPNGDAAHPHPRLTLTFPAIAASRLVVVTVSGADKAPAFARVERGDDVPAAHVRAGRVVWLVDPAAAGRRG